VSQTHACLGFTGSLHVPHIRVLPWDQVHTDYLPNAYIKVPTLFLALIDVLQCRGHYPLRIVNDLQPRFAALRGEKDAAEQTAAGLASEVSFYLITSSNLGLPVISVWLSSRQAISTDAK
jgi:hypothetical protein